MPLLTSTDNTVPFPMPKLRSLRDAFRTLVDTFSQYMLVYAWFGCFLPSPDFQQQIQIFNFAQTLINPVINGSRGRDASKLSAGFCFPNRGVGRSFLRRKHLRFQVFNERKAFGQAAFRACVCAPFATLTLSDVCKIDGAFSIQRHLDSLAVTLDGSSLNNASPL